MHPAAMESYTAARVGVSPPSCRQKVAPSIAPNVCAVAFAPAIAVPSRRRSGGAIAAAEPAASRCVAEAALARVGRQADGERRRTAATLVVVASQAALGGAAPAVAASVAANLPQQQLANEEAAGRARARAAAHKVAHARAAVLGEPRGQRVVVERRVGRQRSKGGEHADGAAQLEVGRPSPATTPAAAEAAPTSALGYGTTRLGARATPVRCASAARSAAVGCSHDATRTAAASSASSRNGWHKSARRRWRSVSGASASSWHEHTLPTTRTCRAAGCARTLARTASRIAAIAAARRSPETLLGSGTLGTTRIAHGARAAARLATNSPARSPVLGAQVRYGLHRQRAVRRADGEGAARRVQPRARRVRRCPQLAPRRWEVDDGDLHGTARTSIFARASQSEL